MWHQAQGREGAFGLLVEGPDLQGDLGDALNVGNLPWAVLLGYLLWGDLPDLWTWVGVALIAGSGIYIVQREAARGRRLVRGWPPMRPRL